MNTIAENLTIIKNQLPKNVTLVAVSKTKPVETIQEAYNAGHRVFGENKIQEMVEKYERLPKDIEWHMIGHLQSNKVKYMAHFVNLIHGVDKLSTLKEINKQAKKHNRVIDCLLQVKIAREDTKFGLSFQEVRDIINADTLQNFENVNVIGLMGMATFTSNDKQIEEEFQSIYSLFQELSKKLPLLKELSIGMSGDFKLAIENGSTMIRVGSAIFGARNY